MGRTESIPSGEVVLSAVMTAVQASFVGHWGDKLICTLCESDFSGFKAPLLSILDHSLVAQFEREREILKPFVFSMAVNMVDLIMNMINGREYRAQYGKAIEELAPLKPFHVCSSPYHSPAVLQQ